MKICVCHSSMKPLSWKNLFFFKVGVLFGSVWYESTYGAQVAGDGY